MGRPPPMAQSATEFEEFFDLSIDLLCIVGFDGYFKRVNPSLVRTLGYPEPELLARSVLEITHPDDVRPSQEALAQLAEGHDVVGFESRVVRADGSVRWLEWNTRTMPERGVVYGAARDTTDLRRLAEGQAALRRLAMLVAEGPAPDDVFAAVGREVGTLLGADAARVVRYVGEEVDQLVGWCAPGYGPLPVGRTPMVETSVTGRVFRTGRPARIDDHVHTAGPLPAAIRELGIQSAVGAPIVVDGSLWGAVTAWLAHPARLPETAEARLAEFTDLVAAAVSSAAKRTELQRLAAEQAALRRVATLVASESPGDAVLAAVVREVGETLRVDAAHLGRYGTDDTVVSVAQWGAYPGPPVGARYPLEGDSVTARVRRSGRAARMETYTDAAGPIADVVRGIGIRSSIGVPISVAGRPWGVMIVSTNSDRPFPAEAESRLQDFTKLLATAVANASAHDRLLALADEQAALRRVATLVARQTAQPELFSAIAKEIGRLLDVDAVEMIRYEDDGTAVALAGWGLLGAPAVPDGTRVQIEGHNVTALVRRTGHAARLDDYGGASGAIAAMVNAGGMRSAVGTPIFVEGRLWGVMIAASRHDHPLPPDTEPRIGQFTELMATAIGNAEARAEAARLTEEQAALRRVATLVAQGGSARAVFDAVTTEVSALLGAEAVTLARYDGDDLVVLAARATRTHLEVGQIVPMDPDNLTAVVRRTGRTARRDDMHDGDSPIGDILQRAGIRSRVVAPVVVEGRTWGVLAASWTEGSPPPEDTEHRMAGFTELLDTAIANADSRDQLTASRARVLAAADDARRRVVRDLHDGAQQRLVHSIVTLKLARQALQEHRPNADDMVAEALGYAEGAIADLRELSHGILPVGLIRGGLGSAVDALVSRLELPVDVEVSCGRLPRDVEASAYFVVAEALTNVAKHARATRAAVRAAVDEGALRVEIADDGVGGADPTGLGLVGIADRVDALDGELAIESGDPTGTVLVARLPLST